MPSDRVSAAVDELKAALADEGVDPGTTDAILRGILPAEHAVVGNYADLQRMGAIAVTGTMPTPPGQDDVQTNDITEAFSGENPAAAPAIEGEGADRTVAELKAELDARGISYTSSMNKAELQAALGQG